MTDPFPRTNLPPGVTEADVSRAADDTAIDDFIEVTKADEREDDGMDLGDRWELCS